MDIAQLAERFTVAHGRPPKSKYELESWFKQCSSRPEGRLFMGRTPVDEHDPKRLRTRVVRQVQRLYREAHGRDGSLVQIERWMRSLEGKAILDAARGPDGRMRLDDDRRDGSAIDEVGM